MEQIASRRRTNTPQDVVPNPLKDKVALITGSCSGISAAIARELSIRGASVIINYPFAHLKGDAEKARESLKSDWIAVETDISTAVGTNSQELQAAYATSKGALATLTRILAKELPPKYGCTVNAVSPGIVKTSQFLHELQRTVPPFLPRVFDSMTPLDGWLGLPEDVAFAVAFVAEERASWINGASINVSGGMFVD